MATLKMKLDFDWADMAFGSKKQLNNLNAVFIAASRELSTKRFTQLVKTYLPQGNIVLGIAKEPYIIGFENQPQFASLDLAVVQLTIDKVNKLSDLHKIYVLHYHQRETNYILDKLLFKQVVFVNGSWRYSFHNKDWFYTLANKNIPYELISPFCDDNEAKAYATRMSPIIDKATFIKSRNTEYGDHEMLAAAGVAARRSYDYSFQTGLALGQKQIKGYRLLATYHNAVVPYETFAWHYGNSREKYFSPPHDLNHYDTIHAEIAALITTDQRIRVGGGMTIFINLLPCPTCSRALAISKIAEIVYTADHSNGYAIHMLEAAGKLVRRIVPQLTEN